MNGYMHGAALCSGGIPASKYINQYIIMNMNRFLNPFGYLSLRKTLCWGIAALIVTSIFVWQTGLRLSSLTQVNFAGDALWMATARQVVVWLLFAVVLYIAGVLLSPSKIRFWDVAADNLFARIPFDLSLLIFAVPRWRSVMGLVADGSINTAMQYVGSLTVAGLVSLVFFVWYVYWSYKAFAVSTNLRNAKGVVTFAVCYIAVYVASMYLLPIM